LIPSGARHGRPPHHLTRATTGPVVPATLSGRPEADMARAMAAALADFEAPTAADVYNKLRQAFPLAPLGSRVAALGEIMERLRRPF
jgi:hypothetical protein